MKRSIVLTAAGSFFLLLLVSCNWGQPTPIPIIEEEAECLPAFPPDGAETMLIPSGSFKMGSVESNDNAAEDEFPEHTVSLTCYNIYKEEVTNSMYDRCVQAGECFPVVPITGSVTEHYADPAYADHPVVGVDYNMAKEYCEWVGGRLPTEAEWEYAATYNKDFLFPWGNQDADCDKANYAGCLDPADTLQVGTLTDGESPFGVQDLSGNAWEWVFDWYDPGYYSVSPSSNPVGPSKGELKAVRGGAYNSDLHLLLSANRHAGNPYRAYNNTGFRCVIGALTLPEDYQDPIPEKHDQPGDTPLNGGPDPEWIVSYLPHPLDCPDGNGDQHLWMTLSSNVPISLTSIFLESAPMTCDPYDDVNDLLHCWVPAPAPDADPNYLLDFCVDVQGYGPLCFNCVPLPKPQNCDDSQIPDRFLASNSCEFNNIVPVEFTFAPAIFWHTVENTAGDALTCFYNSPNKMTCTAPIVLDNGLFRFHLEGTYGGNNYAWNPVLVPMGPCGEQQQGPHAFFFPTCDTTGLMLAVQYSPPGGVLAPVTVGLDDLMCTPVNPGEAACDIPNTHEGNLEQVLVCVDGECFSSAQFMPVCANQQDGYVTIIDNTCYNTGEPGVIVTWYGSTEPASTVSRITANGVELTCHQFNPHTYLCRGLPGNYGDPLAIVVEYDSLPPNSANLFHLPCPQDRYVNLVCSQDDSYSLLVNVMPVGWLEVTEVLMDGSQLACTFPPSQAECSGLNLTPGDTHTFRVCFSDGNCTNYPNMPVPVCSLACDCRLLEVGCRSETSLEFRVQTCAQNPAPLLEGSISATDGSSTYTCALIPGFDGRVYCAGPYPASPGALALQFLFADQSGPYNCSIMNWPDIIPGCQNPPPSLDCSIFTTAESCRANGCNPIFTGGAASAPVFVGCQNP